MIKAITGDITKATDVDTIVTFAYNSLLGGEGVNGVIHRAAVGPVWHGGAEREVKLLACLNTRWCPVTLEQRSSRRSDEESL